MTARLLIVEDDGDSAQLLAGALSRRGHVCDVATSCARALEKIASEEYDLVLTDLDLDGASGLEICAELRVRHPETAAIVISGIATLERAVDALHAGASDLVLKPIDLAALSVSVTRALALRAMRAELYRLRHRDASPVASIVGDTTAIHGLRDLIREIADSDVPVVITGESGTGKELVARALHDQSRRSAAPFVAINCAAIPAQLLESELFGHARGAFTDAARARQGLIRDAGTGTIFLDEVAELPLEMQSKLLRVLQERKLRPVGGDEEVRFEARLVTATNRNLEVEVAEKRFREDLYYRINVLRIDVPALRDRRPDILVLAQHLLDKIARRSGKKVDAITPAAAERLVAYDWPGNVRELENCIEGAVALSQASALTVACLPKAIRDHATIATGPVSLVALDEMKNQYVRKVLEACHGNKTEAARVLGVDRRSIYRRLEPPPAG